LLAITGPAGAQGVRPEPRVGYLYPAGACRGASIEILAGGQALQGMKEVRVSGRGVTGRIVKSYRPVRNLDGDQRKLLQWHIACRRADLDGGSKPPAPKPPPNPDGTPAPEVKLPDMPLLDLLGTLDGTAIRHWMTVMERKDRTQQNNQIGEIVRVEIHVSPDAKPGLREMRFGGPNGFTNPVAFEISTLPETREVEPNESPSSGSAVTTPCVFNGQIQAGDVDLFRFRARRGENLVVRGRARALMPYLADAVPGWFQMVVAVRDATGREIAYGDDFRFDPDPAFRFRVPEDGEYTLEIRDSIHRGREDFVYRVHVGELPFITSVFPLGGAVGTKVLAEIRGWNLPVSSVPLDTTAGDKPVRELEVRSRAGISNEIPYAVDHLPETIEREPNPDSEHAQAVTAPLTVNGRIDKPGDADVFRIEARKGTEIVVEVLARRLRSPLDAVIHIADDSGRILAWNDDLMEKEGHLHLGDGLLTHHADPFARVAIPADGSYFIRITDTLNHGGFDHAYRLRITGVQPDFELRVTPSVVNAAAGGRVPIRVHALRSGGFEGEILLSLKNAPEGFRLAGGRIPPGATQARATLFVPPGRQAGVIGLGLLGTAGPEGAQVTREALPADDTMQAFLWRHLLPAREWLVCVAPGLGKRTPLALEAETPLRIAAGGSSEIRIKVPRWILDRQPQPELSEAPPGLTVSTARPAADGIAFDIRADTSLKPGYETNLIVELYATAAQGSKERNRSLVSGLPAMPIVITTPATP
jgi:hypothetical protein